MVALEVPGVLVGPGAVLVLAPVVVPALVVPVVLAPAGVDPAEAEEPPAEPPLVKQDVEAATNCHYQTSTLGTKNNSRPFWMVKGAD